MPGPKTPVHQNGLRSGKVHDERGFGMLVAVILLSLVLAIVGLSIYNAAIDNVTSAARGVQRDQALQAAETGIDMAYQKIATSPSVFTVPCSTTLTGSLGSAPSASGYTVNFTYYLSTTTTPRTAIACTAVASGSTVPRVVLLTSHGTDLTQTATVKSEANLTSVTINSTLPVAIFSKGNLTFNGNTTFTVANKTIYVTGTMSCSGSGAVIANDLIVFGKATIKCPMLSVVTATHTITIRTMNSNGGGTQTYTLYVTTTTYKITIQKSPTIKGSLYSKGPITIATATWETTFLSTAHPVATGTTVYYKIHAYDTALLPPPRYPFPTAKWTRATLTSKGWLPLNAGSTCPLAYTYIYRAHTAMTTPTTPTYGGNTKKLAVFTTCKIQFPPSTHTTCPPWTTLSKCPNFSLARTLELFSTQGFTIQKTAVISSATKVAFWFIVPTYANGTTGALQSCTHEGNITVFGQVKNTVNAFFYTPCSIKITGNGHVTYGELYGGETINPGGGMTFGVPPTGGGGLFYHTPASSSPIFGVIYIREYS